MKKISKKKEAIIIEQEEEKEVGTVGGSGFFKSGGQMGKLELRCNGVLGGSSRIRVVGR